MSKTNEVVVEVKQQETPPDMAQFIIDTIGDIMRGGMAETELQIWITDLLSKQKALESKIVEMSYENLRLKNDLRVAVGERHEYSEKLVAARAAMYKAQAELGALKGALHTPDFDKQRKANTGVQNA